MNRIDEVLLIAVDSEVIAAEDCNRVIGFDKCSGKVTERKNIVIYEYKLRDDFIDSIN